MSEGIDFVRTKTDQVMEQMGKVLVGQEEVVAYHGGNGGGIGCRQTDIGGDGRGYRRADDAVIARAEVLWREQDFDWLMIGGTEEALGELYDQLPRALHERLAVGLHLPPQTETAKILEYVLSVEREHKQRIEERETLEPQDEEAERARRLEEKMDEALDESFPASDPPYWMPL